MSTSKYSDQVRARALTLSRKGHNYADIGRRLDVPPSTVARWVRDAEPPKRAEAPKRERARHGPRVASPAGAVARGLRRNAPQRRKRLAQLEPERVAVALLLDGASLAQVARRTGVSQAQAERAYLAASRRIADAVKDTVGVPSLKHDRWITAGGGLSGTVTREHPSARHSLSSTGLALAR